MFPGKSKYIVIGLGIVILAMLGILLFVPPIHDRDVSLISSSTVPGMPEPTLSDDGHVEVSAPLAGDLVSSPARIAGNITGGGWFFEGTFPVKVLDADGRVLGEGSAQAMREWMSTGTVPFSAVIPFTKPHFSTGTIVLSKDNPSGDPHNDASVAVEIRFAVSPTIITPSSTVVVSVTPKSSGVRGNVLIGPTCPVERIPPDPACAPKSYVTKIIIYPKNSKTVIAMAATDAWGSFTAVLPVGDYVLAPESGNPYPRCSPMDVHVSAQAFTNVSLSCDSGIR